MKSVMQLFEELVEDGVLAKVGREQVWVHEFVKKLPVGEDDNWN